MFIPVCCLLCSVTCYVEVASSQQASVGSILPLLPGCCDMSTGQESKAAQKLLNEGKFPETNNQWSHLLRHYVYSPDPPHPAIIDKYINNGATSSRAQLNENPLYVQAARLPDVLLTTSTR